MSLPRLSTLCEEVDRLLVPSVVLLCAACFHFHEALGFSHSSAWWTHVSYMFAHGGLLHLCLNLLTFYLLAVAMQPYMPTIFLSLCFAVVASFFSEYDVPTLGLSGVVYAQIGFFARFFLRSTTPYFWIVVAGPNVVGVFLNINVLVHVVAFVLSFILTPLIYKSWTLISKKN